MQMIFKIFPLYLQFCHVFLSDIFLRLCSLLWVLIWSLPFTLKFFSIMFFSSRLHLQSLPFTGSSFSLKSQLMFENIFKMKIAMATYYLTVKFSNYSIIAFCFSHFLYCVVSFPLPGYPGHLGIWLLLAIFK